LAGFPGPSIVVTHDPLEALVLADRILVLEGGRIVQEGPPAEVARRPATEYVARLMGLNLYPGVLVDPAAGKVALDTGGVLFAAGHVGGEPAAASGTPMLVVLAPAAIALHLNRPGPGSSRNVWTGVVSGVELLTDRVRVAVVGHPDQPGQPGALVDVTPAAVAELGLEAGQQIWLSAKATEVIAYPAVPERHGHPDG
jgi:molybdate transport system ATP-binding protein